MSIPIKVVNQRLKIATNLDNLVAGSQEFVQFAFKLGDEWDGLTTFAQFGQNGHYYNQYLDSNNCAYLPSEIVAGECTLALYGTSSTVIAVTNYITLKVDENMISESADSTNISSSLYQQLVAMISDLSDRVAILENT